MSLEELIATLPVDHANARDAKVAKVIAIPSRAELGDELLELFPQYTSELLRSIKDSLPRGSVVAALIPDDKYAEAVLKSDELQLPALLVVDHGILGELFAILARFVRNFARDSDRSDVEIMIHGRIHVINGRDEHLIVDYGGSFTSFDEVHHRVRSILERNGGYPGDEPGTEQGPLVPDHLMGKTANATLLILVAKAELAEVREQMGLEDASGDGTDDHPLVAADFTLFVALNELGQALTGLPSNSSVSGTFQYLSSLFARLANSLSDSEDEDERFNDES